MGDITMLKQKRKGFFTGLSSKKTLVAAIIAVVILAAFFIICFITLDMPPVFKYTVSVTEHSKQTLHVDMIVSVPVFSKKEAVFVFLGDKSITVSSCTDFWGKTKETFLSEDGIVTIPVSRGSKTSLVYDVSVSEPAKHGNRGAIAEDYIVFDGEQAFLLPAEFNIFHETGVKNSAARIEFIFDFPEGWEEIIPFRRVDKPEWIDIYAITKNAYVFGKFNQILSAPNGLKVFSLPGQIPENASGFDELYAYYYDLFESSPPEFSIVLLPPDGSNGEIIGGSGTRTVAASFSYASLRDWQLLSHRLFHAFYDNAAPYVNAHIAPNLWLIEGLATYYENLATDALPKLLKSNLGVGVDRQMALTFNQYLYMRLKEPFVYNFAPMDEDRLTSAAMTEFLHYTAAPLIVELLETESVRAGNPPNALLKYCCNESAFEDHFTAIEAALELLGEKGIAFCDNYMLGTDIPPLWGLKAYQPSSAEILDALNYIETLLANWQQMENKDYPADLVSAEELKQAMDAADNSRVPVMSYELDANVRDYCPELYAIVKDYYRRASMLGFSLDDRDLRQKMMGQTQVEGSK
jgi:hypothetical protein